MTTAIDQPGIYYGELPPSFAYGRCRLEVAYAAFDTSNDSDDLPELRTPKDCRLLLVPTLKKPMFADGKVIIATLTELVSYDGVFDFWAIDSNNSSVEPFGWRWKATLTVDKKTIATWEFIPDSTRPDVSLNIGEQAVTEADPSTIRIVIRDAKIPGLSTAQGMTEAQPGIWV